MCLHFSFNFRNTRNEKLLTYVQMQKCLWKWKATLVCRRNFSKRWMLNLPQKLGNVKCRNSFWNNKLLLQHFSFIVIKHFLHFSTLCYVWIPFFYFKWFWPNQFVGNFNKICRAVIKVIFRLVLVKNTNERRAAVM